MYCPACGTETQNLETFCVNCGALLSSDPVIERHDSRAIAGYRDDTILPKAKHADKGKYPEVNALCAAWRVTTRAVFNKDVTGYVSGLTKPSLSVMISTISGENDPDRVDSYLSGEKVLWHDAMEEDSTFEITGKPGTKSYLKDAVAYGGEKSGILTDEYEVRDSVGPMIKAFLPAMILSYEIDLQKAYEKYNHLVGDYEYERLDKIPVEK